MYSHHCFVVLADGPLVVTHCPLMLAHRSVVFPNSRSLLTALPLLGQPLLMLQLRKESPSPPHQRKIPRHLPQRLKNSNP